MPSNSCIQSSQYGQLLERQRGQLFRASHKNNMPGSGFVPTGAKLLAAECKSLGQDRVDQLQVPRLNKYMNASALPRPCVSILDTLRSTVHKPHPGPPNVTCLHLVVDSSPSWPTNNHTTHLHAATSDLLCTTLHVWLTVCFEQDTQTSTKPPRMTADAVKLFNIHNMSSRCFGKIQASAPPLADRPCLALPRPSRVTPDSATRHGPSANLCISLQISQNSTRRPPPSLPSLPLSPPTRFRNERLPERPLARAKELRVDHRYTPEPHIAFCPIFPPFLRNAP